MEETLPKLRRKSGKAYNAILESEESQDQVVEENERSPRVSISLTRALTSPDSVAMSECASECLLDMPESVPEVTC